ncbi:diguanylate cyclase [Hydrogenimonas sp.]
MMELRRLPIRLLYLEGDAAIRQMTASYLREHVDTLLVAENAREALESLETHRPDVIVTDIELGDSDALELIERIKKNHPDLPVFVTTTFRDTVRLTEAIRHGITHYIHKPSGAGRLLETLREHFKLSGHRFLQLELDEEGIVLSVSRPFAEFLGYEPRELEGRRADAFMHFILAKRPACFADALADSFGSGEPRALFRTKEGGETLLAGTAERIEEGGRVRYASHWYPIDCLVRSHKEADERLQKAHYIKRLLKLHAFISQQAVREMDIRNFLSGVLRELPKADPHLRGCFLTQNERRGELVPECGEDFGCSHLFPARLPLDAPETERAYLPLALAARHGQIVFVDRIDSLADGPFKKSLREMGVETLVAIPTKRPDDGIEAGERKILVLLFERSHRFDKEELELWQSIADAVSFGLSTIRLHLQRDALIARLDTLAHTDSLTGMLNRYRGMELLEHEIARAARYGHPFSLLFFDIDNFKKINDTFGHETGDRVLVEVARAVRGALRRTDTLIRWGGEEFLALLPETPLPEAARLAQKLRHIVENRESGLPFPVTASFGVVEWQRGESLDSLISRADRKMYEAKETGRNRIVC